jgi:hypothetical protein
MNTLSTMQRLVLDILTRRRDLRVDTDSEQIREVGANLYLWIR